MEEGTSPAFLQLLREVIWVYKKYPYLCLCLAWVLELVISGDEVCWNAVFSTLVGVPVFNDMRSELLMTSAISCPRWSSVYEYQSEE